MTSPSPSKPALPLVLVSWDGKSPPFGLFHLDLPPEFNWVVFDYSGTQQAGTYELLGQKADVISAATQCKGEIYSHLADHCAMLNHLPEYIALIDDDILLSVSQINWALHLGRTLALDVFSPSLSHDSFSSHEWTLKQSNRLFREVDQVEVMMPFYRGALFMAGREHYRGNASSWGIDFYLIPMLQQMLGGTRAAILDAVMASHRRPITSGDRVFRNGLTARQEMAAMKQACLAHIDAHAPQLRGTPWFQQVFGEPVPQISLLRRVRDALWPPPHG